MFCLLVVSCFHQVLSQSEMGFHVILFITDYVAIGGKGALTLANLVVAIRHFCRSLSAAIAFFWRCALISPTKLTGSIVVFAQGKVFLTLLKIAFSTAGCEYQTCDDAKYNNVESRFHIFLNAYLNVLFYCDTTFIDILPLLHTIFYTTKAF